MENGAYKITSTIPADLYQGSVIKLKIKLSYTRFISPFLKKRIRYLALIVCIVMMGLLSRKIAWIPLWTGDALYAGMIFFIVRLTFLFKRPAFVAILSLGICLAVECSQLCQAAWISSIRSTLPGRLILGQGFLWSDILAYVAGVTLAFLADRKTYL